jgi:thioredoxin-like negative regulator of GroEL
VAFVLRLSPEAEADLAAAAAVSGRSAASVVREALDDWLRRSATLDAYTASRYHQGDPAIGPQLAHESRVREAAAELGKAVGAADTARRYSQTPSQYPADAADEVRVLLGRLEHLLAAAPEDPRIASLGPVVAKGVAVFGEPPAPPPAAPTLTKAVILRQRSAAEAKRAGIEAYRATARQREMVYRAVGATESADFWEGVAEKLTAKLAKP